MPPIWIFQPQWSNYPEVLQLVPFQRYILNTATIVGLVTVGTLLSCSFCAYGFARLKAPSSDPQIPDWVTRMGVDDLSDRARIAPYVIGGPWVLMDDPDTWTEQGRTDLARAAQVFKTWRGPLRDAVISRPPTTPGSVDSVLARCSDGRALLAVSVPPGVRQIELDPGVVGAYVMHEEWSGTESPQELDGSPWLIDVEPAGDGLILSLTPRPPVTSR